MTSVKAMKQTMFDEFQIKGYWWLPESENQVSGILFYKENKIELELLGILSSDNDKLSFSSIGNHDVILGISDKGEQFTLLDAITMKSTTNFPGYATESFSIDSFIVGGHFKNKIEINFFSCSFNPTYLTKWINRPVFVDKTTIEKGTSKIEGKQLEYVEPTLFEHYVPSLNARIRENYITNFGGNLSENVIWTNKSGLQILSDEWKDLDWFYENMYLLKNLVSLFIGHAIYFESITFYGEEEEFAHSPKRYRKKFKYFIRQNKSKFKAKFNWSDIIIDFKEVEGQLSTILNSWFEKHNDLEVVYDLYFGNFYKDININTSFLNSVQTIEIYHRRLYEGKIFDEIDYEKYSTKVKEFVDETETLPPEFSKKIKDMLLFGNEYSLSKRFREIIKSLSPETKKYLFGNSDSRGKFIQQIVDTRNYLTHYDIGEKQNVLTESKEVYYAIQRLKALTTVLLFKEISVDDTLILNKLKESKQFSYSISKAKELLN